MNAERRKKINGLISALEQIKADIESVADEERDYYDNMPENMQSGRMGCAAEEATNALDEAVNGIDDIVTNLDSAMTG